MCYHQRIHSYKENQETMKKLMFFGHASIVAENGAKWRKMGEIHQEQ
jgi:hypothetical protein